MSSNDIDDDYNNNYVHVDDDDDIDNNNDDDSGDFDGYNDDVDVVDDDVVVDDDDYDDKLQSDRHWHYHHCHHLCIHRRLGIQQGSSKCILDHGFFSKIDTKAVLSLKANPPFKPSPSATHEPLANLPAVRPYHGDQKIFADF